MAQAAVRWNNLPLPVTLKMTIPLSDEELIAFSRRNRPFRVERNREGEITVMTPVTGKSGHFEFELSAALSRWIDEGHAGLGFSPSTGFKLADGSCLSPDVAWMSDARVGALSEEEYDSLVPMCPEFIVEIRSKSDSRKTLEMKMVQWVDNGAQLAWLIDPKEQSVSIYRPGEDVETLERPEVVRGHAPVEGFELNCGRLWE